MGITLAFLICHAFRVTCDIYDMVYFENIVACYQIGKEGVHAWVLYGYEFSNALITLSSSVNMIIYGLIKPNIRKKYFTFRKSKNNEPQHINADGMYFKIIHILQTRGNTVS